MARQHRGNVAENGEMAATHGGSNGNISGEAMRESEIGISGIASVVESENIFVASISAKSNGDAENRK